MSASARILDHFTKNGAEPIRILGASGQLGYGVPTPAFSAGLGRRPHLIGCDMGSIDIGPYYLGSGELATAPAATQRDLRKVLLGALKLKIPLVIGSAGSAGSKPHLEKTLAIVRNIAREEGLKFRMAVLRADIDKAVLKSAVRENGVTPIDDMPALDDSEVDAAANIVGQMGMSAFQRALAAGVDVIIAGRACDTAIFAALPAMIGFPVGPAVHMAKIIECASLCCLPGGRDSILATLDHDGFELESMAPQRCATPVSVAAHSLYEQSDPFTVQEPEGRLDLGRANYRAVDDRRTRVVGAIWQEADAPRVKIEGSRCMGERAVLLCGTADPRFIAGHERLLKEVEGVVRDLVCEDTAEDYSLSWRVYGVNGVRMTPVEQASPPEAFIMAECIAPTRERAAEVVRTTKQYLLHHGYEGRLSTGGNIAFPFTPPEVSVGPAFRFNIYHLMRATNLDALFPMEIETLQQIGRRGRFEPKGLEAPLFHLTPPKVIEAEVFVRLPDRLRRDKAADLTPWSRQECPQRLFLRGPHPGEPLEIDFHLLGEKAAILANRSVQVDVFTNELAATFDLVPRDTADIAPNKQ